MYSSEIGHLKQSLCQTQKQDIGVLVYVTEEGRELVFGVYLQLQTDAPKNIACTWHI